MRREDVTVVVVARTGSERFPNKVMQEIRGRPYISWLLDRVKVLGNVVLATTTSPCDKFLADLATAGNVAVYCGSEQDVLRRVYTAAMIYAPQRYIMVVLGDCPFIATELVAHALQNMDRFENDSFLWLLAPHIWPVYGAREFPYAFDAFQRINHCAPNREHIDLYFHQNRARFNFLLHEPPDNIYFRPYRLELDWPEDLELFRAIADGVGMDAPLPVVIHFLDTHPEISQINRERVEKTGPSVSYSYEQQRQWAKEMQAHSVVLRDGNMVRPCPANAQPIFCQSGKCFLGFASRGTLHLAHNHTTIQGEAHLDCHCGAGKFWHKLR